MTHPVAIEALLEAARQGLDRVQPADLASEMAAGAVVGSVFSGRPTSRAASRPGSDWAGVFPSLHRPAQRTEHRERVRVPTDEPQPGEGIACSHG